MLFEALKRNAGSLPGSIGLRLNGQTYPYAELVERAERLAGGLQDAGIGLGDPVVILMRASPSFFVLTEALFAIGAIAVPLDVQANPSEILRTVKVQLPSNGGDRLRALGGHCVTRQLLLTVEVQSASQRRRG